MFEGNVHMRSVPVRIDATPNDGRFFRRNVVLRANDSPAPTDRRRLPVNKDIVGKRDFTLYEAQKGCYIWLVAAEARTLSNHSFDGTHEASTRLVHDDPLYSKRKQRVLQQVIWYPRHRFLECTSLKQDCNESFHNDNVLCVTIPGLCSTLGGSPLTPGQMIIECPGRC
jgi:hypothetical protein